MHHQWYYLRQNLVADYLIYLAEYLALLYMGTTYY
jgi:hypothetical protein